MAIVGGGCAGIAAAWQLSKNPGYEIDVYEKSWRLGGKGASVRDSEGRILEHGLHVWLGFYENAFRMMRECYAEVEQRGWGPSAEPPGQLMHGRIDDAFLPEPHIGVANPKPGSDWAVWSGLFPPAPGLPGEAVDQRTNPFTLASYLLRCFDLLKTLMLSVIGPPEQDMPGETRAESRSTSDEAVDLNFSLDSTRSAQLLIERMARLLRVGSLTGAAALLQAVTILEVWLRQLNFAPQVADSAVSLMEAVAAQTRKLLRDLVSIDEEIRLKTEVIDIVLTIAVGLFRDRVLFNDRGLDSINQMDYRDWLLQHGATKTSVERSRFLTGIYDLAFAYRDGDRRRPALAAGVALRGALRMFFTYRGSMFWRVRSGMGDAVFAPIYKVLALSHKGENGAPARTSPVRFHFLHELDRVGFDAPSKGERYVSSLTFRTQGDWSALEALSEKALDDVGCWPDNPRQCFAKALEKGGSARELKVGRDFDGVILAMGINDLQRTCADAIRSKDGTPSILPAEWAKMCAEVKTVATQAAQVWLSQGIEDLGWYRGSGLITALDLSFDTWADMTHTLPAERAWRREKESPLDEARSVAYFCATLPESEIAKQPKEPASASISKVEKGVPRTEGIAAGQADKSQLDVQARSSPIQTTEHGLLARALENRIERNLYNLLSKEMRPVWPGAFKGGSNAWDLKIAWHVQANFEGSDRYTQSLPGSVVHRISPLERSVHNMTIAGDWTACGLDTGCVEAAVISGMLAAFAISGKPDPRTIIGYDHP